MLAGAIPAEDRLMTSPALSAAAATKALRRFRRNRRGSAAVEFALVAPVFFALLFAIIETAIVFFAGQVLETVTQDSARMIMTGQAQTAGYSQSQFKTYVCGKISVLFDCVNGIYVDVQSYPGLQQRLDQRPDRCRQEFRATQQLQPRRSRRHRGGAAVLSMAAVRHRARLQHLEFDGQQAAAERDGRIPQRALLEAGDSTMPISHIWFRLRRSAAELSKDCRGVAATEFVMIVPLMLTMFFGMVEFSSGVAVDRKVTLVARTLSDLTSQSTTVTDTDLKNFFAASAGILTPYSATPTKSTITELYVDPTTLKAKVQWSKASTIDSSGNVVLGTSSHAQSDIITVPAALAVGGTYLIWSEVSYKYVPAVGYVMAKAGVTLSDLTYTRPRQSSCVMYNTTVCTTL